MVSPWRKQVTTVTGPVDRSAMARRSHIFPRKLCAWEANAPGGSARTSEDYPEDRQGPADDFDGLELPVDEQAADLDDQPAHELGVDIAIDEPASDTPPEAAERALDLGALLPEAADAAGAPDDDLPGLADSDESSGIVAPTASPEEIAPADEDAAAWTPELALPELDSDDGGELAPPEPWHLDPDARDEPLPELAPTLWHERSLPSASAPCQALALGLGVVVGAGRELLWLAGSASEPRVVPSETGRVESIVLVGQTRQYALYSSAIGTLFRRQPDGSAERLDGWQAVAGADALTRLELCQLGDDCPRRVLGRASNGALVSSRDGGASWERIPLPGRALAVSPHGSPLVVLGESGETRVLFWSETGDDDFVELELPPIARTVGDGSAPLVTAAPGVIALADGGRGLVVSADRGVTFRRVAGCAHVTALGAGELDGKPVVFATLLVESEDRTELVTVDPVSGEAERVGSLRAQPGASDELDDSLERTRVAALRWDADSRCLWLAGNFGLTSWFPPRMTDA
jgi:hypothetical protein